jgi:hypothetical protein
MKAILHVVFDSDFLATLNTAKLLQLTTFVTIAQLVWKRQQDPLQGDKDWLESLKAAMAMIQSHNRIQRFRERRANTEAVQ